MGITLGFISNFFKVAEDHIRVLVEEGQTAEGAAREMSALAKELQADGQEEFAQALIEVSRLHIAKAVKVNAQAEAVRLTPSVNLGDDPR
jgi:hypothetical protein